MKLQILVEWIKLAILIIVLCSMVINAQNYKLNSYNEVLVDTSDFFPLQNGNIWSFAASTIYGPEYLNVKVIKDTLLPNGQVYKYISGYFGESYYRTDSNKIYQYYGDSVACSEREFKYLDFTANDSASWEICRDLGSCGNARGISSTYYDYTYYTYLNKPLETKHFQGVLLDGNDTIWTPCDGSEYWFSKAIGISRIFIFNVGDFWLQGAIINGHQFGTLVNVEDEINIIPSTFKLQAYPNPFNSRVNFNITLPKNGMTEIYLFNILGEKVSTILNDYKSSGNYNIQFNANNLTTGIYLATLRQGLKSTTQKIILLK